MKNVPLKQIARHLGVVCECETPVGGYRIDSRLVGPGELFFALKGGKTDGHHFLGQVKAQGGLAAVVSKGYVGPDFGLVLLPVEDVFGSLQELARDAVLRSGAKVVEITGSVGKTMTKDFIATLLEGKFKVGKTYASYNTKLSLPISVLNLEGGEEVLVLEVGMSEPGDVGKMVQLVPPDVAVLTKVALAHVGFFPDGIEGIARGKAEIFSHSKTKTAIFFHEFLEWESLVVGVAAEKCSFSLTDRTADYFLSDGVVDERGVRAYRFDLPFKQPPILHNFLAAVAVARTFKMEWDEINRQVAKLQLPKMRFEQFEREGIVFVNDAYNANPESMRAALSNLPEPKLGGKRIAVLGSMGDMGAMSKPLHQEVGHFAQPFADHLLCFGEEAKPLCEAFSEVKKPAEWFIDHKKLAKRLRDLMRPGDTVLVKGARAMQMEKIFELLG
ncbi:MAG: UDP-N-acetylmuramoyl-tripeptide--D-alanyl-D-alanine ligase [Verrucomicrobiota bacterium]|nr:UDP-N-acetylmuramoyl-tripeptide--D-alanyl-D-alanine ligase [Verrucomicrobiota bacterium]